MKNYYEMLEIDKHASKEIIEKAYKTLAKKYHPDLQHQDRKNEYEKKLRLYQKDQFINEKLNKLKNHVDEIGLEIINQLEERE